MALDACVEGTPIVSDRSTIKMDVCSTELAGDARNRGAGIQSLRAGSSGTGDLPSAALEFYFFAEKARRLSARGSWSALAHRFPRDEVLNDGWLLLRRVFGIIYSESAWITVSFQVELILRFAQHSTQKKRIDRK